MSDGWISDEDSLPQPPQASQSQSNGYRTSQSQRTANTNRQRYDRRQSSSNWRQHNNRDNSNVETMTVDNAFTGKIIGRGGSKIKELENESQTKLRINSDGSSAIVTITGDASARARARDLITKLTQEDNSHRNSHRNGNNHNEFYMENNEIKFVNSKAPPQQELPQAPIDWKKMEEESIRAEKAYLESLIPINKNFYHEDPEIAGMSDALVEQWRQDNFNISVQNIPTTDIDHGIIPNPVFEFRQAFAQYPDILHEIQKQNFTKPSPIQAQAWPILLSGRDLIGIAQTGTGKTLAFLLPALIHIDGQQVPMDQREGPNVLILAPTRELAIQIRKEVEKYSYRGIKSVCVYGGASKREQIDVITKGVQIVIATPGRLNDLIQSKHLNVKGVTYVVLDEADRMLDMGFGPQIRISLLNVRSDRQTVMTSATWPGDVQRLASGYMKDPVQVVVGTLDLAAVHTVTQEIRFVNDDVNEKFGLLLEFFRTMDANDKVIVFCGRKNTTVHVSSELALMGFNYQAIFSGLEQEDREQALEDMRADVVNILIATDVASRGIDIDNVTHIINFDFPHNLEEFVHRVGRTGRAGRSGTAITFMTRGDWSKASGLIDILKKAGQPVPRELEDMASRYSRKCSENPRNGRGGRGFRRGYN